MPFILECPVEPYPFDFFGEFFKHQANETLCFYQNLKERKIDLFSDKPFQLQMAQQGNDSHSDYLTQKAQNACKELLRTQATDKIGKTIPVEHAVIDLHQINLYQKYG